MAPPQGSTISTTCQDDGLTFTWKQTERHPIQWLFLFFGAVVLPVAIIFPIVFSMEEAELAPPLPVLIFFCGMQLILGSLILYSGLFLRGQETLTLRSDVIEYDTGPTILPLPLMLIFGPFLIFQPGLNEVHGPIRMFRKRHRIDRNTMGQFVLERVGERQRLRVDNGAERIEIGHLLQEPEREWLAEQLITGQDQ